MSLPIFKCKMCGGTLEINAGETVATCEYCGTKQTLPKLDNEKKANLFDRANHFRRNNDFDKAMSIYEQILNEDAEDAESYWSIILCRYGIEYVEDPFSRKRIPTVTRAQFTSIFDDEDYKSAIKYSIGCQKEVYENEAKAINEIQKGILEISQKEESFDVFICYKETDNNGCRTQDSVLATELYHELTKEGFKVFFSRITLEDKLGVAYEPYIFAALHSAKVMVVIGTKSEHFNAVWVKNEWSRYLSLIKNGANKILIPAYRDMDPYDLPEEFSHLQAQDMSKLGFMQDLVRGLKKILGCDEHSFVEKKKPRVVARFSKIKEKRSRQKGEKGEECLVFPINNISKIYYFLSMILNIYFFSEILHRNTDVELWTSYLFAQMLTLLMPTLIIAKKVVSKTLSIVVHSISTLLCLWLSLGCGEISYLFDDGLYALTLFVLVLNLLFLLLICFVKKEKNQSIAKTNGRKTLLPAIIISVFFIVIFATIGIRFCDYQLAKVFYHAGAYEYAYAYFDYLDNYKDSDNLEKDSLGNHALKLIEQGDYKSAMIIVDQMANEKKGNEKTNVVLYNIAESLYNSKQHGRAVEILIKLGDFGNAKNLLSDILEIPASQINTSGYEECTVEELYKNPNKYDGKKVSVTSWKVACYYKNEEKKFYDILLCDDTTYYEYESTSFLGVYQYYKEHILPYGTPYLGVRIFSDSIYANISGRKSMMTVYGTFTFHSGTEGSRRRGDPHVYNLDVDYYVAY